LSTPAGAIRTTQRPENRGPNPHKQPGVPPLPNRPHLPKKTKKGENEGAKTNKPKKKQKDKQIINQSISFLLVSNPWFSLDCSGQKNQPIKLSFDQISVYIVQKETKTNHQVIFSSFSFLFMVN